jgi:hypothetical protein
MCISSSITSSFDEVSIIISCTTPTTRELAMPQYNKNLINDGPEYYWIKRILERDNDQIYPVDRGIALIFIAVYSWQTINHPFTSGQYNRDNIDAWNAFLNGDRSLIQKKVESHTAGEAAMRAAAKEEISDPAFRLRMILYMIVAIVVVVLAFKVLRG